MTKVYLIVAIGDEGVNLDWFVEANTPEEALKMWREDPDLGFEDEREVADAQVFEVPAKTGKPQVFSWFGKEPRAKMVLEDREQ